MARRQKLTENGLEIYWEDVTPAMAQVYLDKMAPNFRKSTDSRVEGYSEAIKEGRWKPLAAGPILLNRQRRMIDGQHRMKAIVRSGRPLLCMVRSGLTEKDAIGIDKGKPRRVVDWLHHRGEKYASCLAGALRYLWFMEEGLSMHSSGYPDEYQTVRTLNKHPQIRDVAAFSRYTTGLLPARLACFVAYYGSHLAFDEDVVVDNARLFLEGVGTGAINKKGLDTDDVRMALRRRLERLKRSTERTTTRGHLAYLILAWNRYVLGEPCERLNWKEVSTKGKKRPFPSFLEWDDEAEA